MSDELQLSITRFDGPTHWRWTLTEAGGAHQAGHEVNLDPAVPEFRAFVDLCGYLEWHTSPDHRLVDEAEAIHRLGAWIGSSVFGPIGEKILAWGTPATVRVLLPPEATGLLCYPFELAHVGGRPLALQDVSLVFEGPQKARTRKAGVGDRLRILAAFSLPTDASALALRHERYSLKRLIEGIAQTSGKAIELRVLQYGVTRQRLKEALEDGEGWDILHLSGHGLAGGLVLEKADGSRDIVEAHDLVELARPARTRVKLAVLSACLSAAATIEETLHWLGLSEPRRAMARKREPAGDAAGDMPTLAWAMVEALDCAVLAMRYPVADDFAIGLAAHLYQGLLDKKLRLPEALQRALRETLRGGPHPGVPPLSVATPALFGKRAASLELRPPAARPGPVAAPETGLAYFPDEPERFVGRVGPLARASGALAAESGKTGVLFHGMAGGGKTACALELAYGHRAGRFGHFGWWKAPDEGQEIDLALPGLALEMEKQLPGLQMVHLVDREEDLLAFLPRLRRTLEEHAILLVLDNLESLLWPSGEWRDRRWGLLVAALLDHRGLSRTVLTSRVAPRDLAGDARLHGEPVHALSLEESVLLARQLPNLGRLLRGKSPATLERDRGLVARTLRLVQGHPKLIDLAEGQAANARALARHLERAEREWDRGAGPLEAFFKKGESSLKAEDFLRALGSWTRAVSSSLAEGPRALFHLLCCLEERDRQRDVVKAVWPHLWKDLGRKGRPPALAPALARLAGAGLAEGQAVSGGQGPSAAVFRLHPAVAAAGQGEAGPEFRQAVDGHLAAFWLAQMQGALQKEGGEAGGLVVLAARQAAPYLLRLHRWDQAAFAIERAVQRDNSPQNLAAALPLVRQVAAATAGTDRELQDAGLLAMVLSGLGRWQEAEALLRQTMAAAAGRGDFRLASAAAGHLVNVLRGRGRLAEALALAGEKASYTRAAGPGPWSQLGDEVLRLQVMALMGRHREVLERVRELRGGQPDLPLGDAPEEAVDPWNVRETLLNTGVRAARALGQWEEALAFSQEVLDSTVARGAPPLELARTRFNDYFPLLRLKRYGQARDLLQDCRAVFQKEQAVAQLGWVLCALADLEDKLGHRQEAVAFEEDALRYSYVAGGPEDCSIGHFNLANYLLRAERRPEEALAHRLAAGLIDFQSGSGKLASTLPALAQHLSSFQGPPPVPRSFDRLCRLVEGVEGVRFRELFQALPRRAPTGDEALAEVLRLARETPLDDAGPAAVGLQETLKALAGKDPAATEAFGEVLERCAEAGVPPERVAPVLGRLAEALAAPEPGPILEAMRQDLEALLQETRGVQE